MRPMSSLALVLCLIPMNGLADEREQQVDALFADYVGNVPGATVAVLRDGAVVYEQAYGLRSYADQTPATTTSNFRLASVSKAFTAFAVMILIDRGHLNLDTNLTDIFPEFPAYGKHIQIRHLLQHTSGVQAYEDLMQRYSTPRPIHDDDILRLMVERTRSTLFTPGSRYSYSNTGYVLLAQAVARVSGRRFSEFLRSEVFDPLGMFRSVAFEDGLNEVEERAYGHARRNGRFVDADQNDTSSTLGDGGVYASVRDLALWDRAWIDTDLVSRDLLRQATSRGTLNDGSSIAYGFGWSIGTYRGEKAVTHTGSTTGFRTAFQRYPDRSLSVVVLVNRAESSPWTIARQIADIYWDEDAN